MATISSAGLGSGLDVNAIIKQLMAIERAPKDQLAKAATATQTQISEVGKITSAVSKLRDLSSKLAASTFWQQTKATSSNAAVSVTSSSSAAVSSYTVNVTALAAAQSIVAGQTFASSSALVGSGTLTLELGNWNAAQTAFTPRTPAASLNVAVTNTDTLTSLRDKINSASAGVTASILTDASGARLVLGSKDTGVANGFAVTVTGGSGGLVSLDYPPTGVKTATLNAPAADARATINGLAITAPSNTINNVVDGVSMTLNTVTTGPVTVGVVSDTETIKKTLTDFAAAYSSLVSLIATDTKYDAASKKAGPLQGDSAVVGVASRLRSLLGSTSTAATAFTRLSDAGFEQQRDGSLTVNDTRLTNALANLPELKALFSTTNLTDPTADGFGRRFRALADNLLNTDGTLTTRSDGLNEKLKRNQKAQDAFEQRLVQIQRRLEAQYGALDTKVSSSNALSGYVGQQITLWNRSTG